jgi:hypothetical protein
MPIQDTGLCNIPVEEIQFRGGFGQDVAPLRSNTGRPIIAIERPGHYDLLDGWGRVSGLINAGAELAHAILVSDEDLAIRVGSGMSVSAIPTTALIARKTSVRRAWRKAVVGRSPPYPDLCRIVPISIWTIRSDSTWRSTDE